MTPGVRIAQAEFAVQDGGLAALERFYIGGLGMACRSHGRDRLHLDAGPATLRFVVGSGTPRPFYHFALLLPGNRFDAARDWLASATRLLSRPGESATSFEFAFWDAQACYAHDPAANIVELIAHRGLEESDRTGPFQAGELRGLSEVGLVGDGLTEFVDELCASGLELWFGHLGHDAHSLGFIGRQAHTLIVCSPGRPWLPTGRPAESHPVSVILTSERGPVIHAGVKDGAVTRLGAIS